LRATLHKKFIQFKQTHFNRTTIPRTSIVFSPNAPRPASPAQHTIHTVLDKFPFSATQTHSINKSLAILARLQQHSRTCHIPLIHLRTPVTSLSLHFSFSFSLSLPPSLRLIRSSCLALSSHLSHFSMRPPLDWSCSCTARAMALFPNTRLHRSLLIQYPVRPTDSGALE